MQALPLKYLAADMVVAAPVTNDKGVVLLAKGTTLTEGLIQRLERMEVAKVTVEGHPVDMPGGQEAKTPEQRLDELNVAFSRLENDPEMMAFKAICVDYVRNPPVEHPGAAETSAEPAEPQAGPAGSAD